MERAQPEFSGTKVRSDHLSRLGAIALAARIRAYWQERGYEVTTVIVPPSQINGLIQNGPAYYGVKTDMVNGMPQRKAQR